MERTEAHQQCLNCGATLTGRYCSTCGQEDYSLVVPLYRLVEDFLSDQFQFDARIWRTLALLLFKPGRLTKSYLSGQRQRHISPIRLYLFVTIVFFLTAAFLPLKPVPVIIGGSHEPGTLTPGAAAQLGSSSATLGTQASASSGVGKLIRQRLAESNRTKSPSVASASSAANGWLTSHIVALNKNPGKFMKRFWSSLPKVLFFLIPVFALLLKLLYLLRKHYYSEHLIFALYYHSALFLYLLAIVLLMLLAHELGGLPSVVLRWTSLALGVWSVIYVFPSMRVAYADTWPRVVLRGLILWLAYSIALVVGTSITMAILLLMFS